MNEQSLDNHWHTMVAQEALKSLDVSEEGLSEAQARERLEETGPNTLEVEEGTGPFRLLLRQVHNPLIYLLAGAASRRSPCSASSHGISPCQSSQGWKPEGHRCFRRGARRHPDP